MITQATLFALFNGSVKLSEQSNNPVFTESTKPGSGNPPWQWDVSNIQWFAGGASFQLVSLGGDGTQARLEWSAIEDSDWKKADGCEGTFDLRIFNNVDPDITYPGFQISLRYIDSLGYTLFENQNGGGSPLPAGDAHTYKFTTPSYGGLPGDFDMAFDSGGTGRGVVTSASTTGEWTADGSCTLRIQDGTRPYSDIALFPVSLRRLEATGYTVFQGQTGGGSPLPAGDAHTYKFTTPSYGGLPGDFDMAFDSGGTGRGVVTSASTTGEWTADGSCTLRIQDGTRPYSDILSVPINLRQLKYTTILWFNNQTTVDPTTINGNPSGASYAWSSSDASVMISDGGGTRVAERITGIGVSTGTDVDFNLTITDGDRPGSVIPCTLKARHVKDPINIPYSTSSGSETVEVTGDSVTEWNFGAGVFSGIESVLSFNGGVGNTVSISWGDDALNNDDSGTMTFTIQPNDASAPSCTVQVNVNISVTTNIVDITKPTVIDCTFEIV